MSSQICIPTIGSILKLTAPWVFVLHYESRNMDLINRLGLPDRPDTYGFSSDVELPKGTELRVDRIYIRKGMADFDSVTFRIVKGCYPNNKKIFGRFWVKLGDANRIICDWVEETIRRDTKVHPLAQLACDGESA